MITHHNSRNGTSEAKDTTDEKPHAPQFSSGNEILSYHTDVLQPRIQTLTTDTLRLRTHMHSADAKTLAGLFETLKREFETLASDLESSSTLWLDDGHGMHTQEYSCAITGELSECASTVSNYAARLIKSGGYFIIPTDEESESITTNEESEQFGQRGLKLSDNQKELIRGHLDEFAAIARTWLKKKEAENQRQIVAPADPFDALFF